MNDDDQLLNQDFGEEPEMPDEEELDGDLSEFYPGEELEGDTY